MTEAYKIAMFWRSLGVSVIPVYYKSKQPKGSWIDYAERLPEDNQLQNWFATRYTNIAVVAGWNGLTVIDFDNMDAFDSWKNWAEDHSPTARKALRMSRMSYSARGVHIYTFCAESYNLKLPGIDILSSRKYALIPPSVHPTGRSYRLHRDAIPVRFDSVRELFPADLIEPAIRQATSIHTGPAEPSASLPSAPYDPWAVASSSDLPSSRSVCEEIKRRYRIQSFFPDAIPSGGNGRWMLARCPFHNDRNPSLSIDTESQTCSCLSSHGCTPLPLDVIGLYARLHNITNNEAISILSKGL